WNTRVLGFYYLSLMMLAAVGLGLLPRLLERVRARRWVGGHTLVATVFLQVCLVTQPQFSRWPVLHSVLDETKSIGWTSEVNPDRWRPNVDVGLGLAALVGVAELASMAAARRRRVAWAA